MRTFLIIGTIVFAGGIIFGASNSGPMAELSPSQTQANAKIASGFILTGFAFMIVSGIMYLRS